MWPTPYVASLRVYEPISSFDPADQLRWSRIGVTENTSRNEQAQALKRMVFAESPALRPDGAHVLEIEGDLFVAPWSTANRCWSAMEQFKSTLPSTITTLFFPPAFEEVVTSGMDFSENVVPHIQTETWTIPPRWFSLFAPEERVRGRHTLGPFTIIRTPISLAKIRCEKTHAVVQTAFGNGQVEEEIEQLANWLEMFNAQSYIELDYGGLAGYLERSLIEHGEGGLEADTSIEDVMSSVAGLASGDASAAGRGYERLMTRWRRVALFEQSI